MQVRLEEIEIQEFERLLRWLNSPGNVWATYFASFDPRPDSETYPFSMRLVCMERARIHGVKYDVRLDIPDQVRMAVEIRRVRFKDIYGSSSESGTIFSVPEAVDWPWVLHWEEEPRISKLRGISLIDPSRIIASMFAAIRGVDKTEE